jgi:3-oxoacyl-[acyl-carrier protein] reductase
VNPDGMATEATTSKLAIVTGGSRGIGRAIAVALSREGYKIAVNFKGNEEAAQDCVDAISEDGGMAMAIQADVSRAWDVERLFDTAQQWGGPVEILVNNAGITRDTLLLRMSEAHWDDVINTNLRSAFLTCKAAIRTMLRQKMGHIINIGSIVGDMGNAAQANYAASKAGLVGLTKSLAAEIGSRGILVNTIAPGFIESDMTEQLSEKARSSYLDQIPLGRFGTCEEVADLAVFLATRNRYITGQVLTIDGGLNP